MLELSELFHQFLRHVHIFIDQPAYLFLLLFTASVLNTFFPPVPIEAAALAAGYLASTGHGSLFVIIASTTIGMFVGGMSLFYLARIYGGAVIERPPLNKLIDRRSYDKGVAWFQKYGVWTLFLGKLVPGMCFCSIVCSGILKLGTKRAVFGIFASNLLFFGAIAVTGMFAGDEARHFIAWIRYLGSYIYLIAAVIVLAVLFFYLRKRSKNS